MQRRRILSGTPVFGPAFAPALIALSVLPCQQALADNAGQTIPATTQASQPHPLPHAGIFNLTLPRLEEKSASGSSQFGNGANEGNVLQGKPMESSGTNSGLHWTTIDSHPGIKYQLDKNEDVRFRLGGHGAGASYALHF